MQAILKSKPPARVQAPPASTCAHRVDPGEAAPEQC